MDIGHYQADIFTHAEQFCDAAIIWASHSLNLMGPSFDEFKNRLTQNESALFLAGERIPVDTELWKSSASSGVWLDVNPPLGTLRHVFFLTNSHNVNDCGDLQLQAGLQAALAGIQQRNIRLVAFNGVRAPGHSKNSSENRRLDDNRVSFIYEFLADWGVAGAPACLKGVHLVTLNDSFIRNAP